MLMMPSLMTAQSKYDQQKPFGFCTRSSRTDASAASAYGITAGGCYTYPIKGVDAAKVTTLVSTGKDQREEIMAAIEKYDVVVFDGAKGDFILGRTMQVDGVKNKTLLGINGAKLRTQWVLTADVRKLLDDAGVLQKSTSGGTGGKLSNGRFVSEEAEMCVRQLLIDYFKDPDEKFRDAGVLKMAHCENIIIRNLNFQGPGSIDVSGADLLAISGATKHVWVDHCDFCDGSDGNFDIGQSSDFITVSWCRFHYSENAYMHQNTNLVGSNDKEPQGYLNTTFAFNNWGDGCKQRMPMARVGKIHLMNNYYSCVGNGASVNPRISSEVMIEGNYFLKGVKVFSQSKALAWEWKDSNIAEGGDKPESNGKVSIPYDYKVVSAKSVPTEVGKYAGATL